MADQGIIASLSAETGRPQEEIKKTLKAYFKALKTNLIAGAEINIEGFGRISTGNSPGDFVHKEKKKRNPGSSKTSMVMESDEAVRYVSSSGNEYVEGHYLQDYNIDTLDDIYTTNTKKILRNLLKDLGIEQKVLAEKVFQITSNTLRAYRLEKNKELPPRLKELAISIKELYVKGKEIFLTYENFNTWINHAQIGLEGRKPIELINTITGIHLVIEELSRIEFGATA